MMLSFTENWIELSKIEEETENKTNKVYFY